MGADATLTVAVIAGGRSSEHDVSLASGAGVRDGLLAAGHEVVWLEVGEDGVWRRDGEAIALELGRGIPEVDVAFPVLHGPFGEDGAVQGALEAIDVPYVGSGVTASAVCLDKVLFKQLMSTTDLVPQVDYVGVHEDRFSADADGVLAELARLGLPVFVKPAHLGSSVGIVKVAEAADLRQALQGAFAYDERAIVEATAPGLEVECAVLGRLRGDRATDGDRATVSEPGEIVYEGDWYDYQAKYIPGGMQLRVPASISAVARERVRELALRAFLYAGCEGLARVDFFVDGERVLVNELNTMPGFTPTSVYAKLMQASGVDYPELVDRLCRLALERQARRRSYSY